MGKRRGGIRSDNTGSRYMEGVAKASLTICIIHELSPLSVFQVMLY